MRAEVPSITLMLAALFAWMYVVQTWIYDPPVATDTVVMWSFIMGPGMIAGFLASYPLTWWMVRRGWKHSM